MKTCKENSSFSKHKPIFLQGEERRRSSENAKGCNASWNSCKGPLVKRRHQCAASSFVWRQANKNTSRQSC